MPINPHENVKRDISDYHTDHKRRQSDLRTSLKERVRSIVSRDKWQELSTRKTQSQEHQQTKAHSLIQKIQGSIQEHNLDIKPNEALEKYYLKPLLEKMSFFIKEHKKTNAPSRVYDSALKLLPKTFRPKEAQARFDAQKNLNLAQRVGTFLQDEIKSLFPDATESEKFALTTELLSHGFSVNEKTSYTLNKAAHVYKTTKDFTLAMGIIGMAFVAGSIGYELSGVDAKKAQIVDEFSEAVQFEQMTSPQMQSMGSKSLKGMGVGTPSNSNPFCEIINHKHEEIEYPNFIYSTAYIPDKEDLTFKEVIQINSDPVTTEPDLTIRILPLRDSSIANRLTKFTNENPLYQALVGEGVYQQLGEKAFGFTEGEAVCIPCAPGFEICGEIDGLKHMKGNLYIATRNFDTKQTVEVPLKYSPATTMTEVPVLDKAFFDDYTAWETQIREELKANKDDASEVKEILNKYLKGPNADDGMLYLIRSDDKNITDFLNELSQSEIRELMFGYCVHSSAMVYGLTADIIPSVAIGGYSNSRSEHQFTMDHTEFVGNAGHAKALLKVGDEVINFESTGKGFTKPFIGAALRSQDMARIISKLDELRESSNEDQRATRIRELRSLLLDSMTRSENDNNRASHSSSI